MVLKAIPVRFGPPHACSYLPGREARLAWVDPAWLAIPGVYTALIEHGFRRNGEDVYRPHCGACQACVSVRIPVAEFAPDRSQRRNWRRNADLTARAAAAEFRDEHYRLYLRYQESRHPDGNMARVSAAEYLGFLACEWQDTVFVEFRQGDRLLAVAITDRLADGLSAVYTFFDPDEPQRGLGTYAVLHTIERARAAGLRWCYLGYWVAGSRTMDYKQRFRPLEARVGDRWLSVAAGKALPAPAATYSGHPGEKPQR